MIVAVLPERWRAHHEATNVLCWCRPKVEVVDGVPLLTHNHPATPQRTRWIVVEHTRQTMPVGYA